MISIGYGAFASCVSLISINLPITLETIDALAFYDCNSLSDIILPPNITSIKNGVFSRCFSLTSITIPNNIVSIQDNAFSYCLALKNINMSDNLESIGDSAFSNCRNLIHITLPTNITSIGSYAFQHCKYLGSSINNPVKFNMNVLTNVGENIFNGCDRFLYFKNNIINRNNTYNIFIQQLRAIVEPHLQILIELVLLSRQDIAEQIFTH